MSNQNKEKHGSGNFIFIFFENQKLGLVVHAYNPNTRHNESGGC